MREIKFRAWNPVSNAMFWSERCKNLSFFFDYVGGIDLADGFALMQYTGLKDSEFKEEYFGDIVEESDGTRRVIEDEASVVAFKVINGKDIKYFWDLLPHKVIANIYENPELITTSS